MVSSRRIEPFGVTVYMCDIPPCVPGDKRPAERKAVMELVREAFGPHARYIHDADGAPVVPGCDSYISVSHCADSAVLAVRKAGPVGVDIEKLRPQLRRIARKFLTPAEYGAGELSDGTLLKLWTAKEAVFKAASDPSLTVSRIEIDLEDLIASDASKNQFDLFFIEYTSEILAIAVPSLNVQHGLPASL